MVEEKKVAYLAEYSTCNMWDIEGMLKTALKELKDNETPPKQAILILLNSEDMKYNHITYTVKLLPSEIIALLSIIQHGFMEDLL